MGLQDKHRREDDILIRPFLRFDGALQRGEVEHLDGTYMGLMVPSPATDDILGRREFAAANPRLLNGVRTRQISETVEAVEVVES